jgi:hypothetical protein
MLYSRVLVHRVELFHHSALYHVLLHFLIVIYMQRCTVLYCTLLHCIVLCCTVLYCIPSEGIALLSSPVQFSKVQHTIVLFSSRGVLYSTLFYCNVLYLYRSPVLHCTVPHRSDTILLSALCYILFCTPYYGITLLRCALSRHRPELDCIVLI